MCQEPVERIERSNSAYRADVLPLAPYRQIIQTLPTISLVFAKSQTQFRRVVPKKGRAGIEPACRCLTDSRNRQTCQRPTREHGTSGKFTIFTREDGGTRTHDE